MWPLRPRGTAQPFGPSRGACFRDLALSYGPVSYWPLQDLTGTVAVDLMNVNNGSYVNGPTLGAAGPFGGSDKAVTFTAASTQYVSIPSSTSLRPADGPQTWVQWINENGEGSTYVTLDKGGGTVGTGNPHIKLNNTISGDVEWSAAGVAVYSATAATQAAIPNATWRMIAVTKANGGAGPNRIYVSGIDSGVTNAVGSMADNNAALNFGRRDDGVFYFNGSMAHVLYYNSVLTDIQLQALVIAGTYGCNWTPGGSPRPWYDITDDLAET